MGPIKSSGIFAGAFLLEWMNEARQPPERVPFAEKPAVWLVRQLPEHARGRAPERALHESADERSDTVARARRAASGTLSS